MVIQLWWSRSAGGSLSSVIEELRFKSRQSPVYNFVGLVNRCCKQLDANLQRFIGRTASFVLLGFFWVLDQGSRPAGRAFCITACCFMTGAGVPCEIWFTAESPR